jgi:prepilin-type N-terminal cleavage/methylation domain-containing protein
MGGNTMKMNKKGFTLIELLIVVAIIAILAAIAIPQFSQYRIKGYNASALTDLRNIRTSEEALFADWQRYGATENVIVTLVGGASGAGTPLLGPTNPATNPTTLGTTDTVGTARGIDIAVGNNIDVQAGDDVLWGSFLLESKNRAGDTVYSADSDSTANYRWQDPTFVTLAMAATAPGIITGGSLAGTLDILLSATTWAAL